MPNDTPTLVDWPEVLHKLAPHACPAAVAAFPTVRGTFEDFKINTPLRQAHFLAQALHETGGLAVLEENLNYSAAALMRVWPTRFPDAATVQKFARNPEAIANKVYGGRMGNTLPGDGWKYRGRGIFQLTGRANYVEMGRRAQLPLEKQPELALSTRYLLPLAAHFWNMRGLSPLADQDDLQGITKKVNGSAVTAPARAIWLMTVKEALGC